MEESAEDAAFVVTLGYLLSAKLGELSNKLRFGIGELLGHFDIDLNDQIASTPTVERRQSA